MKPILFNGHNIEITKKSRNWQGHPHPDFWGAKKIIIYSESGELASKDERSIVQYLYDEGFIEDRRTEVEIKNDKYYGTDGEGI